MRTLRKVFCILILVVLVTSSAALAAPAERADDGTSIGSWAVSVFNAIAAFLLPDELIGGDDTGGIPVDANASADDEYGAVIEPNG